MTEKASCHELVSLLLSPSDENLSYFALMLEDLKLGPRYDGFLFLAESAHNPPTLRAHHHVELELNLVVRGAISYVVGGRRFTFEQGTLLWLFPAQEHQLVDRTREAQNYVAVFKPALIRRSCRSYLYAGLKKRDADGGGVLHARLSPEHFDLVRRTMNALMEGAQNSETLNREAGFGLSAGFRYEHADPDGLNAGLHHLLLLCWRCRQIGESRDAAVAVHPAVRKALAFLSEGDKPGNLAALARHCGASAAHLSRIFAAQIGVPIHRYRNTLRLGRFLALCRGREQKTITESMYAAGFGSYAQFHRVFIEVYGKSPRAYLGSGR